MVKNIRVCFLLMNCIFMFLLCGCSSESDKIVGYWKSVEKIKRIGYHQTQVYAISKDMIVVDGSQTESDIIWKTKDGNIIANKKDWHFKDEDEFTFEIIDSDHIRIWWRNPAASSRANGDEFIRTTKEDIEALIESPDTELKRMGWTVF